MLVEKNKGNDNKTVTHLPLDTDSCVIRFFFFFFTSVDYAMQKKLNP